MTKTDKCWNDGIIVEVSETADDNIKDLDVCMIGNVVPDTLVTICFPDDFHEINIVESSPSAFLSTSSIITGSHMRFKYKEDSSSSAVWRCGFVRKVAGPFVHIEFTDSMRAIARAKRLIKKVPKENLSHCELIPLLPRYTFADDWEDAKLKPNKIPYIGERFIKDKERLKTLTPAQLYYEFWQDDRVSLWDKYFIRGTNDSGKNSKEKSPNGRYKCWRDQTILDLKEAIRLRRAADLLNSPFQEFFSKKFFSGQGGKSGIASNNPHYKFEMLHARFRDHTKEDERINKWIFKYARYRNTFFLFQMSCFLSNLKFVDQ